MIIKLKIENTTLLIQFQNKISKLRSRDKIDTSRTHIHDSLKS